MVQSRIKDFGDISSSSTAEERTVLRFINRFGLMLIVMLVTSQANQAAVFAQESIPETPAGKLMAQLIDIDGVVIAHGLSSLALGSV